jgi:hypothetical protein
MKSTHSCHGRVNCNDDSHERVVAKVALAILSASIHQPVHGADSRGPAA